MSRAIVPVLALLFVGGLLGTARADRLTVTIENTMEIDGFFLTPFWIAAHDGSFDIWSSGELASAFPGLEEIAEEGDTGPISAAFAASSAGLAGGVDATVVAPRVPAPVYSPGESSTFTLSLDDPAAQRYFSYASMVIPSNDLFIATSVPTTHEIYDAGGNFLGPVVIEVYGMDIVDAGTEVNSITGGAAFSALGGTSTTENNPLGDIFVSDPAATYLSTILGTETATGAIIDALPTTAQLIARITIREEIEPEIVVTVESQTPTGGFFLTPLWVAAHDGTFDIWSSGDLATMFPGLEELAEEGDTGPISTAFAASSAGVAGGVDATVTADTVPAPVFSPGENAQLVIGAGNPAINRYFSYASMIIPSNDLFIATSVPTTHMIFDADGNFTGPVVIEVEGSDVVDAGTEVNDIAAGAAFSVLGGMATSENNPLADIYDLDPSATYLNTIVGTDTPTSDTISTVFGPGDPLVRITVSLRQGTPFIRGDVDASGSIDLSDPILLALGLFGGGVMPCEKSADINDSNSLDISDAILLLDYLFSDGFSPAMPFPMCGFDPTPDDLTCNSSSNCP